MKKHNDTKTGWNMKYSSRAIMKWIKTTMKCDEKQNALTEIEMKNMQWTKTTRLD